MRLIVTLLLAACLPATALAEPVEVSSPDLRPVRVRPDRPMGRLIIYANYSTHRILVDGSEFPVYLADSGIEITSNEIHEIVAINASGAEKKYRVSVEPAQTLALYVDLGGAQKADKKKDDKPAKKDEKKPRLVRPRLLNLEGHQRMPGTVLSPRTFMTFNTVLNSGLPVPEKAR